MEFAHDIHREAYERIRAITSKYADFGEMTEAPGFVLAMEFSRLFMLILPFADDHAVLQIRGYLDREFEQTPELTDHLLALNARVVLGAWGWDSSRPFYQYTVLADDIDEPTFHLCMQAVVASLEGTGAELVEQWGMPLESDDASGACETSAEPSAGPPADQEL